MSNEHPPSSWLTIRFLGASALFWLLFALLFRVSLLSYGGLVLRWHEFLQAYLLGYGPFVLATPLLFELTRRLERAGLRPWRYVLQLIGVVLLMTLGHAVLGRVISPASAGPGFYWMVIATKSLPYTAILATGVAVNMAKLAETRRRDLLDAQLRTLRSQLQPHFLFNTLQAIAVTTRRDADAAVGMLTLLGDMLRQTLRRRDSQLVPLSEEFALLQPYLRLQQLRFADRLQVEIDLPTGLLGAAVPDLLLQPLVENALQHGIESTPGAGKVRIRARRDGGNLELQIADDGSGGERHDVIDGIGLGATRARLRALFGDRASLELDTRSPNSTVVTVRLPWQEFDVAA